MKKNGNLIRKTIKTKYNIVNLDMKSINKFMKYIRYCMAQYLNILYDNIDISTNGSHLNYVLDETLLSTINHSQKWVVGVICTSNRSLFRCNIINIRDTNYLRNLLPIILI